jgi:hypothetical protein
VIQRAVSITLRETRQVFLGFDYCALKSPLNEVYWAYVLSLNRVFIGVITLDLRPQKSFSLRDRGGNIRKRSAFFTPELACPGSGPLNR